MNQERNSLKHNDMVLIVYENKTRGSWLLGRIIKSIPDPDGRIRTADVKTKTGVLKRPVAKLCLLEEAHCAKTFINLSLGWLC